MSNIFENIKFGDKFLTRGGNVAIFLHKVGTNGYVTNDEDSKNRYRFGTDIETFTVCENGSYYHDSNEIDCLDIVAKFQEPIDEEAIEKLAKQECSNYEETAWGLYNLGIVEDAFITGYKKAMENK